MRQGFFIRNLAILEMAARIRATRVKTGKPNPVDVHVGSRVRLRRTMLGMSQEKLGEAIGLTFQQVQKYERGANRIGASRLHDLSCVLDVPVAYFFEEYGDGAGSAGADAIGAALVFLHLLEGETESIAQFLLTHAEQRAPKANA